MVCSPRTNGEPKRHRLQGTWLVPRYFQTFDVRSKIDRIAPKFFPHPATSGGHPIAQAGARCDHFDTTVQRGWAAKLQPGLIQKTALGTLHRKGNCSSGTDRIDAQLIAPRRGPKDFICFADTA